MSQKAVVLGKQLQSYVKDYKTGELATTRKLSVAEAIDKEDGDGFGSLAVTYTINQTEFDEQFKLAEVGDEIKVTTSTKVYDGQTRERVTSILLRKKDGKIIGW